MALKRHFSLPAAWLFIIPAAALYGFFAVLPTVQVIRYSLHDWNGISPDLEWVGLGNYEALFKDRIFWQAFINTLKWSAIIVILNVGLGLVIAAALGRIRSGRAFLQACFMIPVVQAPISTAVMWRWMYQPDGIINSVLNASGLHHLAVAWLGSPQLALPAVAVAHSWSTIGLCIAIFLAGLQAVDEELYDAAKIDGANAIQIFRYITLPAIRPVTAVVFVLTLTSAFQAFDLIWAMTQGGPVRSSEILSTYMFKRGALENKYGYGAAIAVALLFIVTVAMMFYLWMRGRWEQRK